MYKQNSVPRDFETQKVRTHDKFRNELSLHKNKFKSKMVHDQVSRGVSVISWLADPLQIFYKFDNDAV